MLLIGLQMRLTVEMHFALKYLPYVYAYYFAFSSEESQDIGWDF